VDTAARRSNCRSAIAAAGSGATARLVPLPSTPSRPAAAAGPSPPSSSELFASSFSGSHAPATNMSPDEALRMPSATEAAPPPEAARAAAAARGAGAGVGSGGRSGDGSGGSGASSSAPISAALCWPGQHAQEISDKAPGGGGDGGGRGGGPANGCESAGAAGAGAAGPKAGSGTSSRSDSVMAARGGGSSSSSYSSLVPLASGGQLPSYLHVAGPASPSPSIPAGAGDGAHPAASGRAETTAAAVESVRLAHQTASKASQDAAALDPETRIKEELIEDMQDSINQEVAGFVPGTFSRLLVEGLGTTATRAAARAVATVAARPTPAAARPVDLCYQVKKEAGRAVESALTSLVSGTSKPYLPAVLSGRVLWETVQGWERNFEFEEGSGGVKRKAEGARAVETVTIDGAGCSMGGRTTAGGSKMPSDDVEILGVDQWLQQADFCQVLASEPAAVAPAAPSPAPAPPAPAPSAAKRMTPAARGIRMIHNDSLGTPASPPSTRSSSGRTARKSRKSAAGSAEVAPGQDGWQLPSIPRRSPRTSHWPTNISSSHSRSSP